MKINNLKDKLITCGMLVALVGIWAAFKLPCVFKAVFKIPCPGCGMTRAYIALLKLDFAKAFEMNFMFWSVPILLLLYLFDGKVFRKGWINTAIFVLIIAGFFVNWIFKLI